MSSPILDATLETQTNTGIPPITSVFYAPTITALRNVSTSLENVSTIDLEANTLVIFTVGEQVHNWLLVPGNADGAHPTRSLQPADYDSIVNNVHWQNVLNTLVYDSSGNALALPDGNTLNFPNGISVTSDNIGISDEIYLSIRADGEVGSGTALDPYNCGATDPLDAAALLDAIWAAHNVNANFYYSPGRYYTKGWKSGVRKSANTNCRHYGAGRGTTIIQLTDAGVGEGVIFGASYNDPCPGFELHDMTLDCDATNQPKWTLGGAAYVIGIKILPDDGVVIDNVEVINFGTSAAAAECFPIFVTAETAAPVRDYKNAIVKNCYVHSPVAGNLDGCSAITVESLQASSTSTNLRAENNVVDLTGSDFVYTHGVTAQYSERNTSIGCGAGLYIEPFGDYPDYYSTNDRFINCDFAIYSSAHDNATCKGIYIRTAIIINDPGKGGQIIINANDPTDAVYREVVITNCQQIMSDGSIDATFVKVYINATPRAVVTNNRINGSRAAYVMDINVTAGGSVSVGENRTTTGVLVGYRLNGISGASQAAMLPVSAAGLVGPFAASLTSASLASATLPAAGAGNNNKFWNDGTHVYFGLGSVWLQLDNAGGGATNGYQTATVSTAGNTDSTQATAVHSVKLIASAGAGAYTRTFTLPVAGKSAGDICKVRVDFAASANPTIEVHDATSGGTLLWSWTGDGTATSAFVDCVFDGAAWYKQSEGFIG